MPRARRLASAVAVLVLAVTGTSCGAARSGPGAAVGPLATWTDDHTSLDVGDLVTGQVVLAGTTGRLTVKLSGAQPFEIPTGCETSSTTTRHSAILGSKLVCVPVGPGPVVFSALVTGAAGGQVRGTVAADHGNATPLPTRSIVGGSPFQPDLRLLSSPDFLNADVGDLRRGPTHWNPSVSTNAINGHYRRTIGAIMDDWESLHPLGVLVAGDLVDGRWGFDDQHTGTFGPVATARQRKAAVRRAAQTFYPQWKARFAAHHLAVFPAPGDHEYGDNPWPRRKRSLIPTFRRQFGQAFTRTADGGYRFADHPPGQAADTAYAGRPAPGVQVISLDDFDITDKRARLGVDHQQLRWVHRVLAADRRDHVRWIIVQGHIPMLWPVPTKGSSGLHYPGGAHSALWKLFERYHVNLYLDGEVHDTSVRQAGGVTQIAHGGAFQFGLTTALVVDFYGDRLYLTLRDYDIRHDDAGPRLWETRRSGMPAKIGLHGPVAATIGTAVLQTNGHLVDTSGILDPLTTPLQN